MFLLNNKKRSIFNKITRLDLRILLSFSFAFLITFIPSPLFAETTLTSLIDDFLDVIDRLILVVLALGLVFFLWGMAKFILRADSETEREKGKQVMIWGLIALFVMVTVWGIIGFMQDQIFSDGVPEPEDFLDI
ncbi:MAG: hypothetical protein ACQEP6_01150 [Patescibacteria group bacterium]